MDSLTDNARIKAEILDVLHSLEHQDFVFFYCGVCFISFVAAIYGLRVVFLNFIVPKTQKTENQIDDFVVRMINKWTEPSMVILLSAWISISLYPINEAVEICVKLMFMSLVCWRVVRLVEDTVVFLLKNYVLEDSDEGRNLLNNFHKVSQVALYSGAAVFVLDNIGFNISSLVASLGIGGIAIALAVQNVLTDAFASFCILLDKQFEVGDLVCVNGHYGHIENIGFKATRIRALTGERIVFSNSAMLGSSVLNYKAATYMNRAFTLGFDVNTSDELVEKVPEILTDAVNAADERVKVAQVYFKAFGAYTLDFEVRYRVESNCNDVGREVLGKINTSINKAVKKFGLNMPFKTKIILSATS